jgi:L-alanine-DL-glutamate epimerase-like enolase superfamily enzyme
VRVVAIAARTHRWPIAGDGAARGRTERASVLLEVRTDRNTIGLGEAAPLPGMSIDTLDDAERALAAFARHTPFDVRTRDMRTGDAPHADSLDPRMPFEITDRDAAQAFATSPPAARFAIETAILDALGREHRVSIATLLAPLVGTSHGAVPLAAVVDDPEAARAAFASGIRCLKVKLTATDDPGRASAIAAAAPEARLRIDANRTWPHSEVVGRLAALAHLPIDYVEEPCREAHRLLAGPLPLRVALDESLLEMTSIEIETALHSPMLAALVLKPTLLGGFSVVLPLASRARRAGVAAIVSHTLEGPIGTAACAELALALGGDDPVGLAPHAALAGWSVDVPQLAADHVRASAAPGLGFADLDLDGVARA